MRRLGRILAAAALVAAVVGVWPQPSAEAADPCAGVWVVVDATAVEGEVTIRCAPGQPASGFDALLETGFTINQVTSFPAFLCQIDGRPASSCQTVPPASAYWSYWQAEPGGDWVASQEGGATRQPPQGSVDGWAFGAGDPPTVPPPSPPPEPEPTPEPEPEAGSDHDDTTSEVHAPSEQVDLDTEATPTQRTALRPDDPRLPRSVAVAAGPGRPPAPDVDHDDERAVLADEQVAAGPHDTRSRLAPTIAGVGLLAAIAVGALLTGDARRRSAHPPAGRAAEGAVPPEEEG